MAKGMRALLDTVMQALPQVNVDPGGVCVWGGGVVYLHRAKSLLDRGRPLKDLRMSVEYFKGTRIQQKL